MLSRCFVDFSVDVGAFVIGLNQISSFFFYIQSKIEVPRDVRNPKGP